MSDGRVAGPTGKKPHQQLSSKSSTGYDYDKNDNELLDSDDALTAEFRHRIGLLPEEEQGLSEAFKSRLGLSGPEEESSLEVNEIEVMMEVEREATLSKFQFSKFVQTHFRATWESFTKEPLKEPLLQHLIGGNNIESLASVAISYAIKRFCKDIDPPSKPPTVYANGASVMSVVFNNFENSKQPLQRKSSKGPELSQKDDKSNKRQSLMKIFSSKSSKSNETTAASQSDQDAMLATVPVNELELVQFIVCHGILRKELRDEIYCQLCCQVTKNPSPESIKRAWMLHELCAGCFMPSQQLVKFYFSFLNNVIGDFKDYATKTKNLVHKTSSFGLRYHPPNSIELNAIKMHKRIMLPVSLADGSSLSIESDSGMTASEMCHKISTAIGLKDQFGFAIYISINEKVSSLGNGSDHVMDAIAECEQVVRSQGRREEDAPWHLFFGKELFTPWHDAESDEKATDLIYRQITRSVQAGEFRLKSEDEMVRFVARRWYVEHGSQLIPGQIQSQLHELLPKALLSGEKPRDGWTQAIMAAFDHMGFLSKKYTREQVKWAVVEGAQRKWPLQFAALFEAFRIDGPALPNNEIVIAVSCRGIFFLEEPYKILLGLHYYEIVDVACTRPTKDRRHGFEVITIKGDKWTFLSPNAETVTKLLCTFLDGLRRRSRWAVAIQQFILQDHTKNSRDVFCLRQGDVVELMDETQQTQLKEDWMFGRSERTGQLGPFPFDCVYIFPTSEKPPQAFLALFAGMSGADVQTLPRKRGAVILSKETIGRHAGHGVQSAI